MRVALLAGGAPNQVALAAKVAERHELAGVVVSRNEVRRREGLAGTGWRGVAARTVGRPFLEAWRGVLSRYAQEYRFPDVARVEVAEINSAETLLALPELESDLFVVSGTNLVRAPLIEFANSGWGMLNLHSGLSPHVKGGPNCTNWCLAQGWFELIGNTVMWIDLGVDSGDIAAAERTPLDGTESLEELHWKVLEHAHELLLRVIDRIAAGEDVPGVSQAEIGAGRTFRNAEWGAKAMLSARRNFRRRYAQALPR